MSGVIGTLFYAILIGGEFDYYMPLGTIAGFIFGLSYSLLIHSKKLVSLFAVRPVYKLGLFLSPILFLVMFLYIFPAVTPKYAYRYMPDGIQHKIFANTISKFKTGDNFKDLVRALPYYFDDHSEAKKTRSFSSSGGGPLIDYDLVVSNDTIVKLVINNKGK